jgi:hypothetical protein
MRIPQLSLGLRKSAASRWNTGPTRFAPPASVSGYSPLRFSMSRRR